MIERSHKSCLTGKWTEIIFYLFPNNKVHGANMRPTWGRQDPGVPHVGHMNLAIWVVTVQVRTFSINERKRLLSMAVNVIMCAELRRTQWTQIPISRHSSNHLSSSSTILPTVLHNLGYQKYNAPGTPFYTRLNDYRAWISNHSHFFLRCDLRDYSLMDLCFDSNSRLCHFAAPGDQEAAAPTNRM